MTVKKLSCSFILLLLLVFPCFAQEEITGFEDKDLPVLNEELRKTRNDITNLESDVDNLVTIPAGVIVMWSGAISDIPSGWVLCDGNNGTPNLTDRFVIHADADSGGTNDVGDTGGTEDISHTHSISNHQHPLDYTTTTLEGGADANVYSDNSDGSFLEQNPVGSGGNVTVRVIKNQTTSSGSATSGTGGSTTFKPKYYALAYIQKT